MAWRLRKLRETTKLHMRNSLNWSGIQVDDFPYNLIGSLYDPAYGIRADTAVAYEFKAFQGFTKNVNGIRKTIDATSTGLSQMNYRACRDEEYEQEVYKVK